MVSRACPFNYGAASGGSWRGDMDAGDTGGPTAPDEGLGDDQAQYGPVRLGAEVDGDDGDGVAEVAAHQQKPGRAGLAEQRLSTCGCSAPGAVAKEVAVRIDVRALAGASVGVDRLDVLAAGSGRPALPHPSLPYAVAAARKPACRAHGGTLIA
jgi:hypothetical protein